MLNTKPYQVRAILSIRPARGPQPLDAPLIATNNVAEAKRFADSKRADYSHGHAIVDLVASTVAIVDCTVSVADLGRLSIDPLPLIPRYFELR
jgi:hypothetical protein